MRWGRRGRVGEWWCGWERREGGSGLSGTRKGGGCVVNVGDAIGAAAARVGRDGATPRDSASGSGQWMGIGKWPPGGADTLGALNGREGRPTAHKKGRDGGQAALCFRRRPDSAAGDEWLPGMEPARTPDNAVAPSRRPAERGPATPSNGGGPSSTRDRAHKREQGAPLVGEARRERHKGLPSRGNVHTSAAEQL